ncbi:MAG: DUF6901 family protein [Elusimicrobiota bacterium]
MEKNNFVEYLYVVRYEGVCKEFKIRLSSDRMAFCESHFKKDPPYWAALDFYKCGECPLESSSSPCCPAALSIAEIVEEFKGVKSFQQVEAEVVTPERKTIGTVTAQTALSSIMGLCLALSGCPILKELTPMARFHLPFSTIEETMYRAAGNYLLRQYYIYKSGEEPDWDLDGLRAFYNRVARVNTCLAERVRESVDEDAGINAVIILDNYAKNVEYLFESSLEKIRKYFSFY